MEIIVNSLTEVLIDGTSQGGVVDALFQAALTGNEAIRAPMLDALAAWRQRQIDAVTADQTAVTDALATSQAALAANQAYQADVLSRAAVAIPSAIQSADWSPVMALLEYAGADLAEKDRLAKLTAAQAAFDAAKAELDALQ